MRGLAGRCTGVRTTHARDRQTYAEQQAGHLGPHVKERALSEAAEGVEEEEEEDEGEALWGGGGGGTGRESLWRGELRRGGGGYETCVVDGRCCRWGQEVEADCYGGCAGGRE